MEDGLDVDIIKWLAAENKIFDKEKVVHNYPHCWRCSTPLIYYAKPSWYIEMSKLKVPGRRGQPSGGDRAQPHLQAAATRTDPLRPHA